ncbi:MAG: phage antirepressor N-terminal domain-containing protein [Candidatus Magnetobacterium sp. LHC-1]
MSLTNSKYSTDNNKKQEVILPAITQINFYGDTLTTIKRHGKIYVAMKPIVEALGLQWEAQYKHLKRDEVLSICMSIMDIQIPGDDQVREMVFLPIDYLNGWLFNVSISRVKNTQVKDKLIRYKKECYKVLFNYFMQPALSKTDIDTAIAMRKLIENRKNETECLKALVEYAEANGSKNANWYYVSYTKLATEIDRLKTRRSL